MDVFQASVDLRAGGWGKSKDRRTIMHLVLQQLQRQLLYRIW
jgi:hypothetical protein